MVLEKILGKPLDSKEIKPVNPKGNQPWIFIGKAVAEAPTLWCKETTLWRRLLGKTEGKRRRERQRMKWLGRITNSMDMNLSTLLEIVEDRGPWHATVHRVTDSWTWLSNLTTEQSHTNTHKTVTYDVFTSFSQGWLRTAIWNVVSMSHKAHLSPNLPSTKLWKQ